MTTTTKQPLPGMATAIDTDHDARTLAQRITDPQRRHPLVVITSDEAGTSSFDADDVATQLRFNADVWFVDAQRSWAMNDRLGSHKVYGDAAAVFPPIKEGRLSHRYFTPSDGHTDESVIVAAKSASLGRPSRRPVTSAPARQASNDGRPPAGVHRLETVQQVDALAHHLLSPTRDRPVAVVTVPMNREVPWIDPDEVAAAVGDDAEVYVLGTGPLTLRLTDHLGQMAGVYGGAGRVYDVGQEWLRDHHTSRLHFAYDRIEGGRAAAGLVSDLVRGLARAGHMSWSPSAATRTVTGTVQGLVTPSRALVNLDDGTLGTIWAELTVPGVDVEALLAPGMAIRGELDPETRRVDVSDMVRPAAQVAAALPSETAVLARVVNVSRDCVCIEPFPGTHSVLHAGEVTGNPIDDLTDLLTASEVVTARYLGPTSDGSSWNLTMLDIDDDEEFAPVAVFEGGPGWLTTSDDVLYDELEVPDTQTPEEDERERLRGALAHAEAKLAQAVTRTDLERHSAQLEAQVRARDLDIQVLLQDVRAGHRERESLRRQVEHHRAQQRRAKQISHRKLSAPQEVHGFADREQQLRWDVQRTWIETTRPEEKADLPLGEYAVGPRFCGTLDQMEGVSRDRVLRVLVLLLTGRQVTDDHPLRSVRSGNAPVVVRVKEGEEWTCRRAPLQQNSPSARRLSYWRSPSGRIELSRVAIHDDLKP